MPELLPTDYQQLLEQFRQALADCRQLYREGAAACLESASESAADDRPDFERLMLDLEGGLVVKIFVEVAQSDWRWSDPEWALARELFAHVWGARLEPDRLRKALEQVSEKAGNLKWGSLVRPFARVPALGDRVSELETVVLRLANLVAKIDGQTSPEEAQRLKWIQSELERHLVPIPLDSSAVPEISTSAAAGRQVLDEVGADMARTRQASLPDRGHGQPGDKPASDEQLAQARRELDGLIGLASIKHDVQELVSFLKVQAQRARLGLPRTSLTLHMVFCGKPGTGKTTVARLLGRILGGMGILARGHLIETDRSGLVAKYAGQTAPKTHKKIDEALDGVLFIDEAYSLVAERGDDPFGSEALQALLKRVEDDRQRLVVVLAGYPEPMERLLESNPGLASRFSRRLDFPDYTAAELGRIFQSMCEKNHYVLPPATRWKLLLGFQHLLDHRDASFGNGRLARNVFEAAIRRLANRIAEIAPLTVELLTTLEPADIALADVPGEAFTELARTSRRLSIDCPGCRQPARFSPALLGQNVKCRRCRHKFQVDWAELVAT